MSEFLKAYCAKEAEQSYEEAAAEFVRLQEKAARAFWLDLWLAHQAKEAACAAEKKPAGSGLPAVGSFWG
ncbi:hypothetical protein BV511_16160 [Methylorubrum extorquens]|uniref:hypothetical protein n=1 Tax=Methylorubrum extorquens TaxID=408 RepID=UPI000972B279|nr:hypothetical protein [Methylorubrum extorquens]APX86091.1 hypothetical protein BV511_16160 [Methylorubrum extorquens]